jgi:hypothetical protein
MAQPREIRLGWRCYLPMGGGTMVQQVVADTAARERLRADSRSWRPVGRHRRRRMKPSPPAAAAASPLLGIRDGSALGPRRRLVNRPAKASLAVPPETRRPGRPTGRSAASTASRMEVRWSGLGVGWGLRRWVAASEQQRGWGGGGVSKVSGRKTCWWVGGFGRAHKEWV